MRAERNAMIDRTHSLPVVRQCQRLGVVRSTAYDQPRPVSETALTLMRRIDELHLQYPFAGARMLRDLLRHEGHAVGRWQVATLMRRMGITAIYRMTRTSQRHPAHRIYPYLLRQLTITRPNHVWGSNITYIPMKRGFVYLCVILNWASRQMLAWRLSDTVTMDFCLDAVQEAITRYGTPEIFNTDQGCQFTSQEFTGLLKTHDIQISMDGIGRWRDYVFVERLWRSLKYEEVYLHAYETVRDAQVGVARDMTSYNRIRPHRALDGRTPDRVYCDNLPARPTADPPGTTYELAEAVQTTGATSPFTTEPAAHAGPQLWRRGRWVGDDFPQDLLGTLQLKSVMDGFVIRIALEAWIRGSTCSRVQSTASRTPLVEIDVRSGWMS